MAGRMWNGVIRLFRWLFRPFFEWFCQYPLLLGFAALVILVLFGALSSIGLPSLFWSEDPWIQRFAGAALGIFFADLCLTGFLLDLDEDWMKDEIPDGTPFGEHIHFSLDSYYSRTLTFLAALVLIAALLQVKQAMPAFDLVILFVISTGIFWIVSRIIVKRWPKSQIANRLLEKLGSFTDRRIKIKKAIPGRYAELPFPLKEVHLLAFFFYALFLILFSALSFLITRVPVLEKIPAAASICLLLILICKFYGFVMFNSEVRNVGWFLLFLIILIILPARQYVIDGIDYRGPAAKISNAIPGPHSEEELMREELLLMARRGGPGNGRLVLVAVSGGGIRAAAWATSVLTALDAGLDGFAPKVHMITGASGGMLGATSYVSDLQNRGVVRLSHARRQELLDMIMKDSLDAAARYLALRDVPLLAFPFVKSRDRGRALENAWLKNNDPLLDKMVGSLKDSENAGFIPSLVYSPTLVEDGRRLIISNKDLSYVLRNDGSLITRNGAAHGDLSISGIQYYRIHSLEKLRLSSASRMNATFSYISPELRLHTDPERHVVDAGYYDDFGVNIAAVWLHHFTAQSLKEVAPRGILLVQIRDTQTEAKRLPASENQDTVMQPREILPWLTTPIAAVLSARVSGMSFRNDEAIEMLMRNLNSINGANYFSTVSFEFSESAQLSWHLTEAEKEKLKDSIYLGENLKRLKRLKQWWKN